MKRFTLLAALCASACGGPDELGGNQSVAAIHLASQLEAATTKVTVHIYAGRDRDDVIVTCTSLLAGNPLADRYELLQAADFTYPPSDATGITINDVKAEDGAVIYVDARNATDQVIGEGCEAGVQVKGGSTATVNITIYPSS